MPIVEMNVDVNASSEKRKSIQVLPTPESPINNNLNNKSYVFFAMAAVLLFNLICAVAENAGNGIFLWIRFNWMQKIH